jgi:membrane-bound lytic murein transglycosylase A
LIGLAGIATAAQGGEQAPIKFPDTQYEPVELGGPRRLGKRRSRHGFCCFLESCRALNSKQPGAEALAIADALKAICGRGLAAVPLEEDGARKFFEDNFRPLRINKLGDTDGFLTGYYEPIIEGSRVPTGQFTAPLYRRPPNLVISGRRKLGDSFPSKGRQGRPPRRSPQDRAVLRSRRDRGWRA